MHPFYFGDSGKRLFGVYHAPSSVPLSFGALLCQPLHGEYIQSHRAMRALGTMLAKKGVPVLRFDYYGTGDSAGASEETSLAQCCDDIVTAARELADTSGATRVVLVGLRLGSILAASVAPRIRNLDSIVLWDPVVKGSDYLAALSSKYETFLRFRGHATTAIHADHRYGGYPISEQMRMELKELDILKVGIQAGRRVFFAHSQTSPGYSELAHRLRDSAAEVVAELVPGQRIWEAKLLESNELIPTAMLQRLTSWIAQT